MRSTLRRLFATSACNHARAADCRGEMQGAGTRDAVQRFVCNALSNVFPRELAAELVDRLPSIDTAPNNIYAADRAQGQLLAIFERHRHPGAAFLRVYHGVTVAVIAALDDQTLTPRRFFERLAGRFAEKHFDGVKAALGLDRAGDAARYGLWTASLAFDSAPAGELAVPLAHFLVGMSCHINLDLAVALAETMCELGCDDAELLAQIERGHDHVDAILASQIAASMDALADELACPLSRMIVDADLVPLAGSTAMEMIRSWRARTFPAARRLCAARTPHAQLREREAIYELGTRATHELFAFLPQLVGLLRVPHAPTALASATRWLAAGGIEPADPLRVARAGRLLRHLDRVGAGAALHALQHRVVEPADRAVSAASRVLRTASMALGLARTMLGLQRLIAQPE